MSSYCTVADVCQAFPQFQRGANNSVTDAAIQGWIDNRKARIRSAILSRGSDPDAPLVTGDAFAFVKSLNLDGAIADLGDALAGTMTLQAGEYSLPGARRTSYERVMKELVQGLHDNLFQPTVSRTTSVKPVMSGIGGAETDTVNSIPRGTQGNNRAFTKNQIF